MFAFLYLLIPMSLVFYRWMSGVARWKLIIICSILSWVFFNTLMWLDPPDNGFANYVYLVSGWVWMIPLFLILLGIDFGITYLWHRKSRFHHYLQARIGVYLFGFSALSIAFCIFIGLFGQMSKAQAIAEARRALTDRGYDPAGTEEASFEQGQWTVRYPETQFKEIRLYRNGRMNWIGGPG